MEIKNNKINMFFCKILENFTCGFLTCGSLHVRPFFGEKWDFPGDHFIPDIEGRKDGKNRDNPLFFSFKRNFFITIKKFV